MTMRRPRSRPVRIGAVSIVVTVGGPREPAIPWEAIGELELPRDGHEVVVVSPTPLDVPVAVGRLAVRALRVPKDASVAAARNAGAAVARGEYLAFLAGGVVPEPRWVRQALDVFRSDARVAAVACRAIRPDGSTAEGGGTLDARGVPRLHVDDPRDLDRARREVLFGSSSALVVETRAFHWVGGYDAEGCHGVEDADLGWRLWRAGMAVVYEPRSVVRVPEEPAGDSPPAASVSAMLAKNLTERAEPRSVVRNLELTPLLGGLPVAAPRVLFVTPDVLAAQMAGPAIRAYELARALAATPVVSSVEVVSTVRCDLEHADVPVGVVDDRGLRRAVDRADIVVVQGHVLDRHPWLAATDRIIVVDAYDPIQFEVLEQSRGLSNVQRRLAIGFARDTVARLLARGDFFLVASHKQRDLLVGQLAEAGRVNAAIYDGDEALTRFIGVVPFGIPDDPPARNATPALRGVVPGIGPGDRIVLWGGGIYNWFDPVTLLHAIDALKSRIPDVRLFFMGMQHPHPEVMEMEMARQARSLAAELGLVGTHVFFNEGWVPYRERARYLLDADLGVSTHLDHVETAYSYRTRLLDYLWAALPVVTTTGDALAELVATRGFGIAVPPNDVRALEAALFVLLTDRDRNETCRAAIGAARSELTWSRAVQDLAAFCACPRRARDLVDPRDRALRGDRAAAIIWGVGWSQSARGAVALVRRGEWREVARRARSRWLAGMR